MLSQPAMIGTYKMATYTDDFNRANGVLSGDWSSAVSTGCKIISNEVNANTSGLCVSALVGETFTDDQTAEIVIATFSSSDRVGPAVRMDGSGNGYMLLENGVEVILYRLDTDTPTQLGYSATTLVGSDVIHLDVTGTTFTASLNGSPLTWAEGYDGVDATHSSGAAGLAYDFGNSNASRMDTFEATGWSGGTSVTQTDTTPTDNVLQTINSSGLTGNYTAASVGGASILSDLNNVVSTTASTYTQDNFVTVEGAVSRISEAVDLSVTATGGTATQSLTIGPATGLAVVTLTSVDRTTGAPDSNMILEIEATGETVAIGDQFYYETADNTSISVAGIPTSDAVTFDLVLIQGSVTSANGVPFTINTASVTSPTLSLPTSASITKTGATIGCTTNESGGTMYFYITANATETSPTIIANGETQTVSGIGIQTRALTGLTQGTNYYGHMVQVDSDTETSNVVNTTQFTTLADDVTPDAFSLGANVTNAELGASTKRSFTSAGIDVSITWTATGAGTVSLTENGVFGASVDAGNATEIWFELDASASYATLVTGGVTAGGVSDSINVTTRAEAAPVLAATKSFNRRINQTSTGVIVPTGGDTPTSYSNPAGADGAQYTINSSGVWSRTVNNPTVESEVFTTTATNAAGTSGVQTVTVTYTSSGIPATKYRRFPWQGYNPL